MTKVRIWQTTLGVLIAVATLTTASADDRLLPIVSDPTVAVTPSVPPPPLAIPATSTVCPGYLVTGNDDQPPLITVTTSVTICLKGTGEVLWQPTSPGQTLTIPSVMKSAGYLPPKVGNFSSQPFGVWTQPKVAYDYLLTLDKSGVIKFTMTDKRPKSPYPLLLAIGLPGDPSSPDALISAYPFVLIGFDEGSKTLVWKSYLPKAP